MFFYCLLLLLLFVSFVVSLQRQNSFLSKREREREKKNFPIWKTIFVFCGDEKHFWNLCGNPWGSHFLLHFLSLFICLFSINFLLCGNRIQKNKETFLIMIIYNAQIYLFTNVRDSSLVWERKFLFQVQMKTCFPNEK